MENYIILIMSLITYKMGRHITRHVFFINCSNIPNRIIEYFELPNNSARELSLRIYNFSQIVQLIYPAYDEADIFWKN